MKDLLQYFHNAELITTQNVDRSLEQYSELLNDLSFLNNCQKFCDGFANDRLDSFYVNNISTVVPRFKIPFHGYQIGLGLFTKNGIQ
jgi:hypothetical protein